MMFSPRFLHGRKSLLLTLCLAASLTASAAPITREQAMQQAAQFLNSRAGSRELTPVTGSRKLAPHHKASATAHELYYVFNRGNAEGYIIVSGDDQTLPVLGYTDSGEFDYNTIPDNMRFWLDGRAKELADLAEHPEAYAAAPRRVVPTHPAIAKMCTSTWNQGDPYNQSCPMYFSLGRSVTGCVATAMAQLLYYQRAKSVTEIQANIPAYTTWTAHPTYGNLSVPGVSKGAPIDWDNMLNSYGSGATAKQKKAVADLMMYCGVAVHMDYTNSSSGAQSSEVADAFKNYFGYGSQTRYVTRNSYSDEGWDALIYGELSAGRPVYLSGANSEGGHAFVCDGYDGNHCYHINWGWGGGSDGFFLLSSLNPAQQGIGGTGDGYNQYQDAVVGIEPVDFENKALPFSNAIAKRLCVEAFDANGDGTFTYGEAAAVKNLGTTFQEAKMTTFDELYYFTSLTALPDDAFQGCTALTSVKLPKRLSAIGTRAFKDCSKLKTLKLTDGLTAIGEEAFEGCKVLTGIELPDGLSAIGARTFKDCAALTTMTFPLSIVSIGDETFAGCTKLKTVTTRTITPQSIALGGGVFQNIDLSGATLNVIQGTRSYFASAEQWRDFGTIYEMRDLSRGQFAELTSGSTYYLYHVGTGRYLSMGEAWGTQAVVGNSPMRFKIEHKSNMPSGTYTLYSPDTGKDGHYLFRTSTDGNVGNGVKACFVDGPNAGSTAYWAISDIGNHVYTIQMPSNQTGFKATEFLGVQTDHASNAASPTYGAYSDIVYADNERGCQWMLVEYDEASSALYEAAEALGNMLHTAANKHISATEEQAVYDDMNSTLEALLAAQKTLRKRLGFIDFADALVRSICVSRWDIDGDGELSYSEAAAVEDLAYNFQGTGIQTFDELQYFTAVTALYGNSFEGCSSLEHITLPASLTTIYYRVFYNCSKLQSIELPKYVTYIGDNTFYRCSSLKDVRLNAFGPEDIELGNNVFGGVSLSNATLQVPYGSKQSFAEALVWKQFGTIQEVRGATMPKFSPITPNVDGYVYNIGTRMFLSKGEAYGTQSVVATKGFKYQFKRSNSMAEGVYYLSSEQTGTTNHVLFRTDSDTKVGEGVKACFVDGTASTKAYWQTGYVDGNIFTMQVPDNDASHVDNQFLGTQTSHESSAASPTYGTYWDIRYNSNERGCQWAFILAEDMEAAERFDENVAELKRMLGVAAEKNVNATDEQAVYDNFDSTADEIAAAIRSIRQKLHYITFGDTRTHQLCVSNWDTNKDGELSFEEAAAVTNLGTVFKGISAVKSFEELRYFTSLTSLPDDAFRGCTNLLSVYIPASVTQIGSNAFAACSAMKYMALPGAKVSLGTSFPRAITIFVPKALMETYAADESWSRCTVAEYTGTPTVTAADASRAYARSNPRFTYTVTGAPVNGEPTLTCQTDVTSPAGEHPIVVSAGSITSENLHCVNGTLTIERVPLTITAKSYTRKQGEPNPDFEATYSGFKNRETEEVLTKRPVFECDAVPGSEGGDYEIRVSGAEAQNYDITYVSGVLTVIPVIGISGVAADETEQTLYDLQGRSLPARQATKPGVYVRGGKKIVKK